MSAIAIAWLRLGLSGKTAEVKSTEPEAAGSDRALIAAVAASDKGAMQLLYSRHSVRVFRFISRIVKNPQLAEDLVNEVFLDVWRSARSFRGKSQVSTWLLSIARHKAFSALRRRCDEQLDDAALATVEDPRDDPEALMDKEHLGVIVRKCLGQLSPAHREVLDLVYYYDKSIDEIAEIVGIPASTVKTRAFYARSHTEKFLKSAGVAAL
jgi:RNA polymerase sigma-70 factor, ECF subfamily